jgi:hypothetical protein
MSSTSLLPSTLGQKAMSAFSILDSDLIYEKAIEISDSGKRAWDADRFRHTEEHILGTDEGIGEGGLVAESDMQVSEGERWSR